MAVAASADTNAAYSLLPRRGAPIFVAPTYPAWIQIPKRVIDHPDALPAAAQVFVRSLSPASEVTFGIESASDRPHDGFLVRMMARYTSDREAQNVSEHLTRLTRMLGALASKDQKNTGNHGIRELLTSAAFVAGDKQVKGQWHVSSRFLDSVLE
jgi:hypothetical protein